MLSGWLSWKKRRKVKKKVDKSGFFFFFFLLSHHNTRHMILMGSKDFLYNIIFGFGSTSSKEKMFVGQFKRKNVFDYLFSSMVRNGRASMDQF